MRLSGTNEMEIKKITIEQLKEGFLVTDQDDERYAVVSLLSWLEQHFDIPKEDLKPESKKKS